MFYRNNSGKFTILLIIVNVMVSNLLKIITFILLSLENPILAQEIWRESFSTSERGVWGDEDGATTNQDFSGVSSWTLDFSNIKLSDINDYAKTVATSGGRFECRDINGEVIWRSEIINIADTKIISLLVFNILLFYLFNAF